MKVNMVLAIEQMTNVIKTAATFSSEIKQQMGRFEEFEAEQAKNTNLAKQSAPKQQQQPSQNKLNDDFAIVSQDTKGGAGDHGEDATLGKAIEFSVFQKNFERLDKIQNLKSIQMKPFVEDAKKQRQLQPLIAGLPSFTTLFDFCNIQRNVASKDPRLPVYQYMISRILEKYAQGSDATQNKATLLLKLVEDKKEPVKKLTPLLKNRIPLNAQANVPVNIAEVQNIEVTLTNTLDSTKSQIIILHRIDCINSNGQISHVFEGQGFLRAKSSSFFKQVRISKMTSHDNYEALSFDKGRDWSTLIEALGDKIEKTLSPNAIKSN
ncbi:hypothetical protein FGO68_gene1477 [Halteria grandinella]|uniref:Uncharacterized protein n=1 Tax=Halteria grandinella TaxID=5974 RepID=A0A8J8ND31_HALGN|nr:hypothetical protein FGO68_gene1477 [Halteria grandinella]